MEALSNFSTEGKRQMCQQMEGKIESDFLLLMGETITILRAQSKDPGEK